MLFSGVNAKVCNDFTDASILSTGQEPGPRHLLNSRLSNGGIMLYRNAALRICLALFMILTIGSSVFADTVRLKDGSIIKGRIVSFGNGQFVVVVGEGTSRRREMTFTADEVESIQFDAVQPATQAVQQVVNTSAPRTSNPRVVTTDNSVRPITEPGPPQKADPGPAPAVVTPVKRSTGQPIALSVRVLADNTSNGWTNSGWVVKKGQRIRITASGSVSLGSGRISMPGGVAGIADADKLLKAVPTGALIAVIGDDNNDFMFIGNGREFTAERDGSLFLGVNEGNLNDNTGAYDVKVEIMP